uniref:Putative secreted peptide n=1 Tax=Anopheles braziliensis TaxID=58242 RepID=A0A2M3ZS36_9DIPT
MPVLVLVLLPAPRQPRAVMGSLIGSESRRRRENMVQFQEEVERCQPHRQQQRPVVVGVVKRFPISPVPGSMPSIGLWKRSVRDSFSICSVPAGRHATDRQRHCASC